MKNNATGFNKIKMAVIALTAVFILALVVGC